MCHAASCVLVVYTFVARFCDRVRIGGGYDIHSRGGSSVTHREAFKAWRRKIIFVTPHH